MLKNVYYFGAADIEDGVRRIKEGDLGKGGYSVWDKKNVMAGLNQMQLEGKRVLVIGSISPWLESLILAYGAAHVVTLEYSQITTDHEKLTTYMPHEFIAAYLNDSLAPFDAMVTFSSLEHSGLGRFGEELHPWGDLVTMARVWCVTKESAKVLVGAEASQHDVIAFNAHKCYGPLMFSHLFANFEFVWSSHPKMVNTSNYNCTEYVQSVTVVQRVP